MEKHLEKSAAVNLDLSQHLLWEENTRWEAKKVLSVCLHVHKYTHTFVHTCTYTHARTHICSGLQEK